MAQSNSIKMLSIDDRSVTTDLDRAGYRKMGVVVKSAKSFDEGFKILGQEPIDMIVINMDYKGVDAVQSCKHLKSLADYQHIPIVLTSVQTSARVRNLALDAGADLFVEQPLPRQYFIEKVKLLLEQKTRTTARVTIGGQIAYTGKSGGGSCEIGDLSVSGVLLKTDETLPLGDRLKLEINLPGVRKSIKIEGVVVRIISKDSNPDQNFGIGVKFEKFIADGERLLTHFIDQNSSEQSGMLYYL